MSFWIRKFLEANVILYWMISKLKLPVPKLALPLLTLICITCISSGLPGLSLKLPGVVKRCSAVNPSLVAKSGVKVSRMLANDQLTAIKVFNKTIIIYWYWPHRMNSYCSGWLLCVRQRRHAREGSIYKLYVEQIHQLGNRSCYWGFFISNYEN